MAVATGEWAQVLLQPVASKFAEEELWGGRRWGWGGGRGEAVDQKSWTTQRYLVARRALAACSSGPPEAGCLLTLPSGPTHGVTSSRKLTLPISAGFRPPLSIILSPGL